MIDLPLALRLATVQGWFTQAVADSSDIDTEPDMRGMSGTVTFAPNIERVMVPTASPQPMIVFPKPIVCGLDEDGFLLGPDGARRVTLVATGDLIPSYTVTFDLDTVNRFSIVVLMPEGAVVDLSTALEVPLAPAEEIDAWTEVAVRAETAATLAVETANELSMIALIQTVNGVTPDANGAIVIPYVDAVNGKAGSVVLNADDIAGTAARIWFTMAERAKLADVAPSATANSTDAALRDRATHTGLQAVNTLSDFDAAVATAIAAKAEDSEVVHAAGDETVAGIKTFTLSPVVPAASFAPAAIDGFDAAAVSAASRATFPHTIISDFTASVNLLIASVVDSAPAALNTLKKLATAIGNDANYAATVTAALATKALDSAVVHKTGSETVAGIKTFSSPPVVPSASFPPTAINGFDAAAVAAVGVHTPEWSNIAGLPKAFPSMALDYGTWTPSAPATLYPYGTSSTLVSPAVGWPVSSLYGNVITTKVYGTGGATIQYWSSYQTNDQSVYYRQWFNNPLEWGPWRRLAVVGENGVPFAQAAGEVAGSASWATVTWPAGRFTQPPKVTAQQYSGAGSAIGQSAMVTNITTTSCIMRIDGTYAATIHWQAIQMTSGSASG